VKADLSKIVKEAFEINSDVFVQLAEDATKLICSENGKMNNFTVLGRLVVMNPQGEALVVGDLHGDLESLIDILTSSDFVRKMTQSKDTVAIFLGDYGDRGAYSAEVYYTVLKLKLLFPEQVVLMRGNHEGPADLMADPHDLPYQFQLRFGEKWKAAYSATRGLFGCLYNAVLVKERFLMIHGGLPVEARTLEDLAFAHVNHPKEKILEEMLWSDPNEMSGETSSSPRGAGKLFGKKITNEVLNRFGVRALIRGHEPCEDGFKIDHGGKILTLFSRRGPPYVNTHGAYLLVNLSGKFENAKQLIPYVRKF